MRGKGRELRLRGVWSCGVNEWAWMDYEMGMMEIWMPDDGEKGKRDMKGDKCRSQD